jgi:hypothetical protein
MMARNLPLACLLLLLADPAVAEPDAPLRIDDARLEADAFQESLESTGTNDVSIWSNPDGVSFGTITPVLEYRNDIGAHCREYRKTVVTADRKHRAHGAACRGPEGVWQIVRAERVERVAPEPVPRVEPTVIRHDRVVVLGAIYIPVGYYAPAALPLWAVRGWARSSGPAKLAYRRIDGDRRGNRLRQKTPTRSRFFGGVRAHGGHWKSFPRAGFRTGH